MAGFTSGSSHNSTDSRIHSKISSKTIKEERVIPAKALSSIYSAKVAEAYRTRRIFTIFDNFNSLRRSLLKRGWLEKLPPNRFSKLQKLSKEVLLMHAKNGNDYEAVLISKIINHFPAFFIWQPKEQRDLYVDVFPYRNRLRIAHHLDFSTKVGLISCAEQQHWYRAGQADIFHPRFFRLGANHEERLAFVEDYRITQCCCLLRFLIKFFDKNENIADNQKGTIHSTIVQFALDRLRRKLEDCDNSAFLDIEPSQVPEEEWAHFLINSSKVISEGEKIKCSYRELAEFVKSSNNLVAKIEEKNPDLKWDGYKNWWILKPGYLNRGRGIVIFNSLDAILQWSNTYSKHHYIVQKYIEEPLLIYRTKFDIRQYMLICVRESTVQIWLYTDCYLRFSSQEYNTNDFNESIHLTNNCVQRKYKNDTNRNARLPKNNMWSLDQFKVYLKTQRFLEDIWENRVFAGFREILVAAVSPSLDETNLCENSFELFGCDFMLDEQHNPILIEINATPDLSHSTDITARICPMVLEDCLKVVVDLPRNNRSSTGLFEMVYEVNYKYKQDLNDKEGLSVIGKSVEFSKPVGLSERLRLNKKPKIGKKHQSKRNSEEKASELSSKISKSFLLNEGSKVLKAATKEALALRYTTPN